MINNRYSYFNHVVECRHFFWRHVDTAMTAVVYPDIASEFITPVGIVEAFTGPCDTKPVFNRAFVFSAVCIIAFEDNICNLIQYIISSDVGGCSGIAAAGNAFL